MIDTLSFSQTLASRLCHDLITPVGAIQTGLELLQQTPDPHSTDFQEILNLILDSAQNTAVRLAFFRAAFGSAGKSLEEKEIKEIASAYSKLDLVWKNALPPACGHLVLNTILWLADCAPHGGALEISYPVFTLTGKALIAPSETTALSPRTVPYYLLQALGARVTIAASENEVRVEVKED